MTASREEMAELMERLRRYRPTNEWGDGVHHVICTDAADTIEQLTRELDEAREAFRAVFAHLDRPPNAPGHAHDIPGVWDNDISNGERAGQPCGWCATWERARTILNQDQG